MHQNRWTIPSILIIIAITALTQTTTCTATESQNTSLTETKGYHFNEGYYNIVSYAENSTADYWIFHQTKIPYINITYTAPSHGYLSVTLHPTQGNVPYIELSPGWDTDGLTYTSPMLKGETSYMLLTPPMQFSDQNTSSIVGGSIMKWEIYRWGNTTGEITHAFTASEDIILDLIMYPTDPKQGESITFFTDSNAEIKNTTWSISELDWLNQSQILEIDTLDARTYTVTVEGIDDFNNTHKASITFTVDPPTLNPQSYELSFFSVTYPETVILGSQVTISATIDYSIPVEAQLKCQLFNPSQDTVTHEQIYNVSGSGSKHFTHQFPAQIEGTEAVLLRLYYDTGAGWVEETSSEEQIIFTVAPPETNQIIPGFNPVSLLTGMVILVYIIQKNK